MNYLVAFEMGFSKNKCFFDDQEDAITFAKSIKNIPQIKSVFLYKIEYDYDLTKLISCGNL